MPDFTWMAKEEELSAAALTVRAQAVDPTDQGLLLWDQFMPRRSVDQTKLSSLRNRNVRITADRRDWNLRGRYIPLVTPAGKELEWIPIEAYFKLEEKEINDLMNEVRGNQALFRDVIRVRIPERTDDIASANYRRLELDVMSAWANGGFNSMNPQTGAVANIDYGFDVGRYQVAGVAWSDATVNAYDEFLGWWADALAEVGPMAGVMLRQATRRAIQLDAPNAMPGAVADLTPTITQVEARIRDETGMPFRFFINENTVDTFVDAGVTRQQTKTWPAQKIAAIPADNRIGETAFAPVVRAYEISDQTPEAGVDVRGVTVYHEIGNGGRDLTVEGQFNPMPDPDEARIFVMNAGV